MPVGSTYAISPAVYMEHSRQLDRTLLETKSVALNSQIQRYLGDCLNDDQSTTTTFHQMTHMYIHTVELRAISCKIHKIELMLN